MNIYVIIILINIIAWIYAKKEIKELKKEIRLIRMIALASILLSVIAIERLNKAQLTTINPDGVWTIGLFTFSSIILVIVYEL